MKQIFDNDRNNSVKVCLFEWYNFSSGSKVPIKIYCNLRWWNFLKRYTTYYLLKTNTSDRNVESDQPVEFFTIGVSVRLSDRSLHREEQKKLSKIAPSGIETRTSGSSGQCSTNWARQESLGQEISEVSFVCFMHHFTCWTPGFNPHWGQFLTIFFCSSLCKDLSETPTREKLKCCNWS